MELTSKDARIALKVTRNIHITHNFSKRIFPPGRWLVGANEQVSPRRRATSAVVIGPLSLLVMEKVLPGVAWNTSGTYLSSINVLAMT